MWHSSQEPRSAGHFEGNGPGAAAPAQEVTDVRSDHPVKVGHAVPDFELTTYDPVAHGFSKFSLAEAKKAKKWTILFFYPADFTFV